MDSSSNSYEELEEMGEESDTVPIAPTSRSPSFIYRSLSESESKSSLGLDIEALKKSQEKPKNEFLNKYSHRTLLDEWEDIQRYERWNIIRYCRNRVSQGLVVQNTFLRLGYLLKEVKLEKSDIAIAHDMQLQITAPHIPVPNTNQKGVYLSSTLSDCDEEVLLVANRAAMLSWSPHFYPCFKNVFCLKSIDPMRKVGERFAYGEQFYIATVADTEQSVLYVGAKSKVAGLLENASNHCAVKFYTQPTPACLWKAIAAKPEEREPKNGTVVYLDDFIHLVNVLLGLKLSVESMFLFHTLFGLEFEATAYNHKKLRAKDSIENCLTFTINARKAKHWPPKFIVDDQGRSRALYYDPLRDQK